MGATGATTGCSTSLAALSSDAASTASAAYREGTASDWAVSGTAASVAVLSRALSGAAASSPGVIPASSALAAAGQSTTTSANQLSLAHIAHIRAAAARMRDTRGDCTDEI